MSRRWAGSLFLFFYCVLGLAARAEEVPAAEPAVEASTAPVEPGYVYKGDRMRDPFIPLTGGGGGMDMMSSRTELGPFNPASAELKGIVKTPTGRWALIRTPEGATYLIQNGKIFDPKRKPLAGYQGIVKDKSVFIMAPGSQEFELKLKKDEEVPKKSG